MSTIPTVPTYVGIDISKTRLDVHVRPNDSVVSVSRDPAGLVRALADLVTRRRQMVEMITAEGHRKREARDPNMANRIRGHLAWLRQELTDIERELDKAVKSSPAWLAD